MILSHTDLAAYYQNIHIVAKNSVYSLTELEDMMPFEFEIYSELILNDIQKRQQQIEQG